MAINLICREPSTPRAPAHATAGPSTPSIKRERPLDEDDVALHLLSPVKLHARDLGEKPNLTISKAIYTSPIVYVSIPADKVKMNVPKVIIDSCPVLAAQVRGSSPYYLSLPNASATILNFVFNFLQFRTYSYTQEDANQDNESCFNTHLRIYALAKTYEIDGLASLALVNSSRELPIPFDDFMDIAAEVLPLLPADETWFSDLFEFELVETLRFPISPGRKRMLCAMVTEGGQLASKLLEVILDRLVVQRGAAK